MTDASSRRRIALLLEYDGGRYAGSQYQENAPTIQSVLEEAVLATTGERVRVAFAGRTDSGVHAKGQVASFLTAGALTPATLRNALNARLPRDIAVVRAAETPIEFDVRRAARRRHYRYVILNRPARPALGRDFAWHVRQPLDVGAMASAAGRLVGRHDFAAFGSPLEKAAASSVRTLFCFDVGRALDRVLFDLTADAFLSHQVRRMAGALVNVGAGKLSPDGYGALLDGLPASAGPSAPGHGLYLMSVDYGRPVFDDDTLASEAGVC